MRNLRTVICIIVVSALTLSVKSTAHSAAPSFLRMNETFGGSLNSAKSLSADGATVVGRTFTPLGTEAIRWSEGSQVMVLGHLPGGQPESAADDTSADGMVVVGQAVSADGLEAFRWTERSGMVGLRGLNGSVFESKAYAVSADGSVVVGLSFSASGAEAFRWTEHSGMVGLGDLPGGDSSSVAYSVSADGSVVVGEGTSAQGDEAFRWTEEAGMVGLGGLAGGSLDSTATDVSADGSVVVGRSHSAVGIEAFRWTEEDGMVGLGHLPGHTESVAMAVSADGLVVVGWSIGSPGAEAFIWDRTHGMRRLAEVLTDLGTDLSGWKLSRAVDVSADGKAILGTAFTADGRTANWVANFAPQPALATVAPITYGKSALLIALTALAAIGGLIIARSLRRAPLPVGINVGAVLGISITALFTTLAQAAPYTITDLGVTGAENTLGWGINASGQVTGYAGTPEGDIITGFVWNPTTPNSPNGTLHRLDTLGGYFGWGIGINASGQVAGLSFTIDIEPDHATLWIPSTPNGSTGTIYDLQTLGGTYSQGTGINDSGQVTGYADLADDAESHAIMWKPAVFGSASGTMHDLGTLGGTQSFGWDINASGQVTGDSSTTDDEATHAMLWKPTVPNGTTGTMYDLGTLGGTTSTGEGINDKGQVAGYSLTTDDEAAHAVLWTPTTLGGVTGTMVDLGTLGGTDSYGIAVSNSGRVIGTSAVPYEVSYDYHAFLYTRTTGMVDLNMLIDPLSGWELQYAHDINDAGQITGQGIIGDEYHAFLLTPSLPGDFDFDSDVDGEDFLMWQRGESFSPLSADDLADWEASYGTEPNPFAAATSSVPEPTSLLLAVLVLLGVGLLRNRF